MVLGFGAGRDSLCHFPAGHGWDWCQEIETPKKGPVMSLGDGEKKILWNSETRQLEGDQELIEQIRSELNGRQETICDVGAICMDEREPIAVTFLASTSVWNLVLMLPSTGG